MSNTLFGWKPKEEELHNYIEDLYKNQGYECHNYHKSGAAVEGGIDIFCVSKNKSVAIAVKLKPKSIDLKQATLFSKTKANERVYIYLDEPPRPTLEKLKALNIKLVSSGELHTAFIENKVAPYIKIHLFNHKIFTHFLQIFNVLSKTQRIRVKKINFKDKKELENSIDLKDRVISLHKSASAHVTIYKRLINHLSEEQGYTYRDWFIQTEIALNTLAWDSEKLLNRVEEIHKTSPHILAGLWQLCVARSLFYLEAQNIVESPNPKNRFFESFNIYTSNEPYNLLISILGFVAQYGDDFEQAVDLLFEGQFER